MAIDTHVHFWQYQKEKDAWITDDMKILQQDFYPENLLSELKANGVSGCVAVQASSSEQETDFLIALANKNPMIRGVVGWIDFQQENIAERLQYYSQFPIVKGWRHVVQAEPDDFLLGKKFQNGIAELAAFAYTYDLLIFPKQLDAAISFIAKFPVQKMIIDHAAKPSIALGEIKKWETGIKTIAATNCCCKLSGLFTEAVWNNWTENTFYPYLDILFAAFGTDRLLFGSDWPVIQLAGTYTQWKELLEKYMLQFSVAEREKVLTTNAVNFYQL